MLFESRRVPVIGRSQAILPEAVNPAPPIFFYVVTDGRSFRIWAAPEAEDQLFEPLRPRFHLVQSFPNRTEAEAFRQFVSSIGRV